MPFVLKKKDSTHKWPVTVSIPVDGGKFRKESFTIEFVKIGRSRFNELVDQDEMTLVLSIVKGWEGVTDEEGDDVPYTDETAAELFDDPFVLRAVINAYADFFQGAQSKN